MAGKLVTIATFDQSSDAHIARSAVEAAGIPVTLNNEESSALFGQVTNALGGIHLVVKEEDEPAAVKVLDDTFGGDPVDDEDLAAQAEAAPAEDPVDAGQQPAESVSDPLADSAAREKDARVALQAAAIGMVIPFATLFAIVMILQASFGPGSLSSRGRRHLYAATVLAFWPLALLVLVVLVLSILSVR